MCDLKVTHGVQKANRVPGEGKAALQETMETGSSRHLSPSLLRALSLASGTPDALQGLTTRCWCSSVCSAGVALYALLVQLCMCCMPKFAPQGSRTRLLVYVVLLAHLVQLQHLWFGIPVQCETTSGGVLMMWSCRPVVQGHEAVM